MSKVSDANPPSQPSDLSDELPGSAAHFRLLFQKNPNPMWLYDRKTLAFIEVNEAMLERYGWSAEEFASMTLVDIRPPEEVPRLLRSLSGAQSSLHKGEWRHRTKDGKPLDVMIASYAVQLGGREAALVVATDIGNLKRAERALQDSEARLRQAQRLASIGDWVWWPAAVQTDWQNGISEYSEEAAALFGVSPQEMAGDTNNYLARFVHPDDRDKAAAIFGDLVQPSSDGYKVKYRILRADGAVRTIQEIAENVFERDGSLRLTRGTIQDITEQELLEAQLHQAQKMEALGKLTGGVAHDFNNLLTVIMGNVEMMREQLTADRPELAALGEVALTAAQRAAALTTRLLSFARQTVLQAESIDLTRLSGEIEPLLRQILGPQQELVIRLAPDLPPVLADRSQLENAIINLVVNARDAMTDGGRLCIEARRFDTDSGDTANLPDVRPGNYVRLAVADNGAGMSREVTERAFEPFFSTKGLGKGSGLGLSMVYGFVRQSGGFAAIDSALGQGTTVSLYLPVAQPVVETALAAQPVAAPAAEGKVVLLVEDDPGIRRLALSQLDRLGYRTLEAANGQAAEAILRGSEHIDLLFSDVVMPGGQGGLELARLATALRPALKCLLMSGYADDAFASDTAGAATLPFLAKPFRRQELAAAVRAALVGPTPDGLSPPGT